MRREYGKQPGVVSIDTRITGAVVKLKAGNRALFENFWTIADKLSTEPQEARVVMAGRLLVEAGEKFVFEVSGTSRRYELKPNPKLTAELHALAGQKVVVEAEIAILASGRTEARLRRVLEGTRY